MRKSEEEESFESNEIDNEQNKEDSEDDNQLNDQQNIDSNENNNEQDNSSENIKGESNDLNDSDESNQTNNEEKIENNNQANPTKKRKKSNRTKPKMIKTKSQVTSIDTHPTRNIIASGEITGLITLYTYDNVFGDPKIQTIKNHKESCRELSFSVDGKEMYSGSTDLRICSYDVEGGKKKWEIKKSHEDSISSLISFGQNMIASGDDSGIIKIWDTRKDKKEVFSYEKHKDFVSSLTHKENLIISTSGDGHLNVYHCRNGKNKATSEEYDDELLCSSPIRHGSHFITGTSNGNILVWDDGKWFGQQQTFTGLKQRGSVDCLIKLNESTIGVGCGDGTVNIVSILPNKYCENLGFHTKHESVEKLRLFNESNFMISSSHSKVIRFWDVQIYTNLLENETNEKENQTQKKPTKKKKKKKGFFDDL